MTPPKKKQTYFSYLFIKKIILGFYLFIYYYYYYLAILSSRWTGYYPPKRNEPHLAKGQKIKWVFKKNSCLLWAINRDSLSKYGEMRLFTTPQNMATNYDDDM